MWPAAQESSLFHPGSRDLTGFGTRRGSMVVVVSCHSLLLISCLFFTFQRLSELEASRDELLRVGNKTEQTMLLDYFSGVKDLSDTLWKQLSINLKRTINIARKEPSLLVTCLRILEREEKADKLALQVGTWDCYLAYCLFCSMS
jgi:hypothetical protein